MTRIPLLVLLALAATAPAMAADPDPTRCKALADILAKDHDRSVMAMNLMLAIGPDNGATDQELSDLEQKAEAHKAKAAAARAVAARYASAPAPDAALVKELDNTVFSNLNAEFLGCG